MSNQAFHMRFAAAVAVVAFGFTGLAVAGHRCDAFWFGTFFLTMAAGLAEIIYLSFAE